MDFHSLTRRELQALCKKNKIPANLTNVSMADSLRSLQIVEGIEELLDPSESVSAQSTIESPEKSEVSSPCVPRTGGRTTRRRAAKDQVENSQVSTRVRRSTRKLVVGEVGDEKRNKGIETPAPTNTRRTQVASVRRKMDSQLKEVEEDKKIEKEDISKTPRGPSTVKIAYSTRRSTRLVEKNKDNTNLKNEKLESFKGELFVEESGENLEISDVKVAECSDDLGEVVESADIYLKEILDEGLERNNDTVIEKEIRLESKFDEESSENFEVVESEMKIEEDAIEGHESNIEDKAADDLKTEVHSQICEETNPSTDIFDKPLEMADEIKENSGADFFLTNKEDVVENVGDKLNVNEEMASPDIAESVEEEVISQESGKSLDVGSLLIHSKAKEQAMDLVTALETMTLEKTEDSLAEDVIEETVVVELNASADVVNLPSSSYSALPVPTADDLGQIPVFDCTADSGNFFSTSAETELIDTVLSTCLTPSKKSASKTPAKKSASKKTPTTIKKLSHVFDDKENIDNSCTKLILTKEKKKIEGFGQLPKYEGFSLRKLKKTVKEKTEMSKKKDEQVMSSRPALQAVSENIVAE